MAQILEGSLPFWRWDSSSYSEPWVNMDLTLCDRHCGCVDYNLIQALTSSTVQGVANTCVLSNCHWGERGGDPSGLWFRRSEFGTGNSWFVWAAHVIQMCSQVWEPYFSVALIPRIHIPEQRGIRTESVDSFSFSEQNARLTSLRLLQLMSEQVVFLVPYREFLCPQFPRDGRKRAALRVEISDILEISECLVLQLHSLNLYHLTTRGWFMKELTF